MVDPAFHSPSWRLADVAPQLGAQLLGDGELRPTCLSMDTRTLVPGACFGAVTQAGCSHEAIVVGGRKPKDVPEFLWVNTVLGNLKTSLKGCYHSFAFRKYATRYLSAFACS